LKILGVDPGIATVGYGIVDYTGNKFTFSEYGAILTPAKTPLEDRLEQIYDELIKLIDYYKIENMATEELFFNTNTKTAIHVAHGRGVILLSAVKAGIKCYEYTPLQVKQAVVGYGRAEKLQVMAMVKMLLNLKEIPKPDDAADALAIAICHAHSIRL
jgi:crossover junction endodeoxyribonuclease RuvC